MKVESIAECPPWHILQYFWPALSDNWAWKPIFGLSENDRFTQVLVYVSELFSIFLSKRRAISLSLQLYSISIDNYTCQHFDKKREEKLFRWLFLNS